ncbi:MAG: RHS repeat-associated core domain-containing protein [Psychrobium sp.]
MKGRIYDPTFGRFLQVDQHIQAPKNSQNYNRCCYVLNNPLSYTDPSGYFFKSLWKGVKNALRTIENVNFGVSAIFDFA